MSQHPRASQIGAYVKALKAAGEQVASIEVRWEGETPVWTITTKTGEKKAKPAPEKPVEW